MVARVAVFLVIGALSVSGLPRLVSAADRDRPAEDGCSDVTSALDQLLCDSGDEVTRQDHAVSDKMDQVWADAMAISDVMARFMKCRQITGDAARLLCYDASVADFEKLGVVFRERSAE